MATVTTTLHLHIQRASVTGAAVLVPLEVTDVVGPSLLRQWHCAPAQHRLRENSSLRTAPEVVACYSAGLVVLATRGDNGAWVRFTIISSLQLRALLRYSSRMLVLAVCFSEFGVGEWLDNNSWENFRLPEDVQ